MEFLQLFKKHWRKIVRLVLILVIILVGATVIFSQLKKTGELPPALEKFVTGRNLTVAEQEGKKYTNGRCSGNDVKQLTHSPLAPEDITNILPYGGVVGAHVMPISHGYIWPGKMNDPRDKYNVYAMADSTLFSISSRSVNVDTGEAKQAEYQLQFSISCVEFYYYDLITSLTPELQKYLDEQPSQSQFGNSVSVSIPIKGGQLLGKIGGQTLDYAVWDFNKTLTGYIVPEHYEEDFPRIHLVSPFDYMNDEIRQTLLPKLARGAEPIEGKVDYDIDGKLIGGWFMEGSGSYGGLHQGNGRYWAGHLAIIPDYHDPTFMGISIGTYIPEQEAQFAISRDAPDPRNIGVESGLVKYDLYQGDHTLSDGGMWDRFTPVKDLRGKTNGPSQGCAVFQLTEARKLRAEFFPKKACAQVVGFTVAATFYER